MTLLELVSALDPVRVTSFVAFVSSVWLLAGWLKRRQLVRTGDARKINHAAVLVGGVFWFDSGRDLNDRVDCHLAVLILFSLLLMACRWRDSWAFRDVFYGYARESDRPHDAFHVWFSWLVSILGLEAVDILFQSTDLTRCTVLVLGLADALGEPIGSRFGRHPYFVRDLLTSACRQRSWEGSLAVGLMTAVIIYLGFSPWFWTHGLASSPGSPGPLLAALLAGLIVSLVEAWTPHGLDNLTIPISAALVLRSLSLVWH